ncbi:MAG TPA: NRDE family protein [Steroidobacteraceae bacterium]|nr:NRDE family protein [Steroidobacteraceae bacterium]
MCLLVLAWQAHPRYRLVVAANRDEFHERPTAPLARWPAPDEVLAGRDLRARGTWLGLDRRRRFGVITNFRELQPRRPDAPSRGLLIPEFLRGRDERDHEGERDDGGGRDQGRGTGLGRSGEDDPSGRPSAEAYLRRLEAEASHYAGFNLLLADEDSLWYASNRSEGFARPLPPGVYGLSNEFLDTPWPKLKRVRQRFDAWLSVPGQASPAELFALLDDRTRVGTDEELPKTGIAPEWERVLSAPFVQHPDYGTRCSTVLLLEPSGAGYLAERRFDARGVQQGQTEFSLAAGEWP